MFAQWKDAQHAGYMRGLAALWLPDKKQEYTRIFFERCAMEQKRMDNNNNKKSRERRSVIRRSNANDQLSKMVFFVLVFGVFIPLPFIRWNSMHTLVPACSCRYIRESLQNSRTIQIGLIFFTFSLKSNERTWANGCSWPISRSNWIESVMSTANSAQ